MINNCNDKSSIVAIYFIFIHYSNFYFEVNIYSKALRVFNSTSCKTTLNVYQTIVYIYTKYNNVKYTLVKNFSLFWLKIEIQTNYQELTKRSYPDTRHVNIEFSLNSRRNLLFVFIVICGS